MAISVTKEDIEAMGLSPATTALVDVGEPLATSECSEGEDDGSAE